MTPDGELGRGRLRPDAVLDACVLVPSSLRGVLLNASEAGGFSAAWSEPILAEVRGVLLGRNMMGPAQWSRLDGALRTYFPDALVPEAGIRAIEPTMPNHPKDRHVLAAAVASGTETVVTNNLKDFRAGDLRRVGVRAMHPDAFLVQLLDRAPDLMHGALTRQVVSMRAHGKWTEGQLLGHFAGLGRGQAMAPRFAARAEQALGIRAVAPPPPRSAQRGRSVSPVRQSAGLGR